MSTLAPPKKQPSATAEDWHPADVVAALRKAGWSLRGLSVHHGFSPWTLRHAQARSYPRAEALIAEAIGVKPEVIWPTRYAERERKKELRKA